MKNYQVIDETLEKPIVSVAMLAYNHSKYINEAIDSVLMQETDFPLQLVIAEDYSPDNTREIILDYQKKYPHIIKLVLQNQNVGAKQNNYDLFENLDGKYVAALEGDDYWVTKNKLQRQLFFLEAEENVGLVYTNAMLLENGVFSNRIFSYTNNQKLGIKNCIPTLTTFFINDQSLFKELFDILRNKQWPLGDYPLWLIIGRKYEIKGLDEVTGVYRITPGTASRPSLYSKEFDFIKAIFEIQVLFNNGNEVKIISNNFLREYIKFFIRRGKDIEYNDFILYKDYVKSIKEVSFCLKLLALIVSYKVVALVLSITFDFFKKIK
ncbi:glycosyltransferase [Myroides marinus]|uniref:glycosyltransferase n=1 Tax=Myroides marinus TaxID=703342 RepID=UPI0025777A9D|nr:glycosyltransferase [Myroides marinus]MDM1348438.1 glycosyltransferase [Myroides marinus]